MEEEEEEEKVNGEEEKENGVADHNHKPLTVHGFVFFFFPFRISGHKILSLDASLILT